MIIRPCLLFLFSMALFLRVNGQISHGGIPASFSSLKQNFLNVPFIEMEPVKNADLINEEKSSTYKLKPFRFAKSFEVNLDPSNSGKWEKIAGKRIWRLGIRSKGAWSLNLIFDKMILPEKASLFIYTPDLTRISGAYTSRNEQSSGYFTFFPIPSDEIIVEYDEPEDGLGLGQIHIAKVNHDYKNAFGTRPLGEAGLCNRDVYCPDVAAYAKEKQAVVDLIIAGHELCTGTLINNVRQDGTPYMITAGHCISDSSEANQTLICFNYESPYCGNGKSSLNGFVDQTLNGTLLKSRSDSLDFALVELETTPPVEFRPYYAGWNRSNNIPSSTFSIHHPKGDVKKVSVDNNPPTIGNFSTDFLNSAFWVIGKWEAGTTESGSSGGPLFNQNKLMVGSLTGGTSTCSDPTDDLFAMFSKQWNHYSSTNQQLKAWLDPDNTGVAEISSLNPYSQTQSCDLFSNMIYGESYTLQHLGNVSGGYISGHNYQKITNYAEKFVQTKQTQLTDIAIGVAKSISTGNGNSLIHLQIFKEDSVSGLPGEKLMTMDIPLNLLSQNKMNLVTLDNPLQVKGKYFVGYELNYTNPSDTFAIYTTSRKKTSQNKAFIQQDGFWKPFYAFPGIDQPTSLLIDAQGCQSIAADTIPPTPTEANKFKILYPQTGVSDYVYLQNTGTEEYVRINLYDMSGRKMFIRQENITSVPQLIALENYSSGIYFLTIEGSAGTQVIKIRINRQQ